MNGKKNTGNILRLCLLLLFGAAFLAGALLTGKSLYGRREAENAYESLRTAVHAPLPTERLPGGTAAAEENAGPEEPEKPKAAAPAPTPAGTPAAAAPAVSETEPAEDGAPEEKSAEPPASVDFDSLKAVSPEICAWLYADWISVDYPVMHTDNNEYYLDHLYNGTVNSSGSLFADCRNTGLFSDGNTVIYGHHMKNGTMFGSLAAYRDQSFYDAHPVLYLYTPQGNWRIELFSGTAEDGNREFVRFDFEDEADFEAYAASLRARSVFRSSVTPEPGDRLVSLCTCSYERDNARFQLVGRLVPAER